MRPVLFKNFKSTKGATLVEYGIILGFVSVGAIVSLVSMGGNISGTMQSASDSIEEGSVIETQTPPPPVDEEEEDETRATVIAELFSINGDVLSIRGGTGEALFAHDGTESSGLTSTGQAISLSGAMPVQDCEIRSATYRIVRNWGGEPDTTYRDFTVEWENRGYFRFVAEFGENGNDSYSNSNASWYAPGDIQAQSAYISTPPGC